LPAYFGIRPFPFVIMLCRSSAEAAATLSEISEGPRNAALLQSSHDSLRNLS
jgi:hypothetical protein